MGRMLKYLIVAVAALAALLIIAVVAFLLLFDPNDFREDIAQRVSTATGREFSIEGELDVSLFPWLAIEVGRTQLGNAEGFSEQPFARFEKARLSVRLLPMLLRRELIVGSAELDALQLSLEVRKDGRSNWQDLADRGEAAADAPEQTSQAGSSLDIASIQLTNATLIYSNAQLGEEYRLSNVSLTSGAVVRGKPVEIQGGFGFEAQPADVNGVVKIETDVAFVSDSATIQFANFGISGTANNLAEVPTTFELTAPAIELKTEERNADFGSIELSVLDINVSADIEPFSYADSPTPVATIKVDAFSPRSLMQTLNIELPATADPSTFGKLIVDAKAVVSEESVRLDNLELVFDETTFKGTLQVPRESSGAYQLDLSADSIDLNRYMPPTEEGASGDSEDVAATQIPADLIRPLNARGKLSVREATMGQILFENVELGVNAANGQMRVHPISADIFDGKYNGDVRINVSGDVPTISLNENIQSVSLQPLAKAMFERDNITGAINGTFTLNGRGEDMDQIRGTLNGDMSFVLSDGVWEGKDVWYELRRARALLKQEQAPEPELPPRTRFSEVKATGKVTDGILHNDDFFAELPFMQMTGQGTVNFQTATIDYNLKGRVLEKPEFVEAATQDEVNELTRAVIPFRITGPLAAPDIKVDVSALLRERAKEEIRERLVDSLLGGDDDAETEGETDDPEQSPEEELEDKVKDRLKDLLKR